jgi:hypothetical protein
MRPHDIADLALAPVALAIDARLEELAELSGPELAYRVALESGIDTMSSDQRLRGMLICITYTIDMHDWSVEWDARGLKLKHGTHSIVLGVPKEVKAFLDGPN